MQLDLNCFLSNSFQFYISLLLYKSLDKKYNEVLALNIYPDNFLLGWIWFPSCHTVKWFHCSIYWLLLQTFSRSVHSVRRWCGVIYPHYVTWWITTDGTRIRTKHITFFHDNMTVSQGRLRRDRYYFWSVWQHINIINHTTSMTRN